MAIANNAPVILLTFANVQDTYLAYLPLLQQEIRYLQETLERPETPYEVRLRPSLTVNQLITTLRDFRHRIVIFHYAGHADAYGLFLEAANGAAEVAHAGGLAKLLAQQGALQLVFLNGCSTAEQARALLEGGVPVVVATSQAIPDEVAAPFANHFYAGLVNDMTIQEAFDDAIAAVETSHGALLQAAAEQAGAGTELDFWQLYYTDRLAVQQRFSALIRNPLWGLPPLPRQDIPPKPFLNLAWFRRKDAEIFFGRSTEIRDLYQRIVDPTAPPILLLYGQSGVGKSSLLEAGLLPRLEAEYLCCYVRRDQALGLTGTLDKALGVDATHQTAHIAWLAQEAQATKPLVIILDQVEEAFTRPQAEQPHELAKFLATIVHLFAQEEQRPQGKLILSFRKEYLAEIEQRLLEQNVTPAKVFLESLNKQGIIEAITGVIQSPRLQKQYGLTLAPVDAEELPILIADDLLEDANSPLAPTLQILLTKMWEQAQAQNRSKPVFDTHLYRLLKRQGIALADFLAQQMFTLHGQNAEVVDSGLALDLLAYHTTPLGTAAQHPTTALAQLYPHHQSILPTLLQQCEDLYLLVHAGADQAERDIRSLAHDALAPLVRDRFDRSDAPGQRAWRILQNRAMEWTDGKQGTPLDEQDLGLVEQGVPGMRAWTAAEQALVDASRQARTRRKLVRRTLWSMTIITLSSFVVTLGLFWLLQQNQINNRTQTDSQLLSTLAKQQLTIDPVASLQLSLRALPSAADPKPYVPAAEFVLSQGLRTSRERSYWATTGLGLSENQVKWGKQWIAVGSRALNLVRYDLSQAVTLTHDTGLIQAVRWEEEGEMLLSSTTYTVSVWQGEKLLATQTLQGRVWCSEWRPHTETMALCIGNGLRLWSFRQNTLQEVYDFPGGVDQEHIRWSPDGKWLAAWDVATQTVSQTLLLWSDETGSQSLTTTFPYTDRITALAWSPDSQQVAATLASGKVYLGAPNAPGQRMEVGAQVSDGAIDGIEFIDTTRFVTWGWGDTARLWSVNGQQLRQLGTEVVQGVQLSPDHKQLLALGNSSEARLWDVNSAVQVATLSGHEGRILAAAWYTGYLATSSIDGTVRIWHITDCAQGCTAMITLRGHTEGNVPGRADVLGVHWLADGQLLTWGEDGSLRRWQIFDKQGLPLCNGTGLDHLPVCFDFSQTLTMTTQAGLTLSSAHWLDNDTILTTDDDGTARRFSLSSGQVRQWQDPSGSSSILLWDPPGQQVFTYAEEGSDDQRPGQVWDMASGRLIATITGPIASAFWLDSGLLVSQESGAARLVAPATGKTVFELPGLTSKITAVRQRSGRLATAEENGVIHIWNSQTGQEFSQVGQNQPLADQIPVYELYWTTDGKWLLAAGQALALWNVETGEKIWSLPERVAKIHIDVDRDEQLAAVTLDSELVVLNLADKQVLWRKGGFSESLLGIRWVTGAQWPNQDRYSAFISNLVRWVNGDAWRTSNQRLLLLTWGGDGTARLWDWESQTEILRVSDDGPIDFAALSGDGLHLFTAGYSGKLRIWQVWMQSPGEMVVSAQRNLTHPFFGQSSTASLSQN